MCKKLNYMIIGAGATGGAIGSHLAHTGCDVTFIARGKTLEKLKADGIKILQPESEFTVNPINVCSMDDYPEDKSPDVIFVCVKGYSVDGVLPFIEHIAGPNTIVIPILNVYGTGAGMQQSLTKTIALDGCIYIWAKIEEPGVIYMSNTIFRVIYGLRKDQANLKSGLAPVLSIINEDLRSAGIEGIVSDNIERDALRKFSLVSPQGACGLYYDVTAGAMQQEGEIRDCLAGLIKEISDLADAMGAGLGEDIVSNNLKVVDSLDPGLTTSMQRDVAAGGNSEVEGLVYEVVKMGERYDVATPYYSKIADELKSRNL